MTPNDDHPHAEDIEAVWADEVKRRIGDADAGGLELMTWDEARDDLLNELRQIRSRRR